MYMYALLYMCIYQYKVFLIFLDQVFSIVCVLSVRWTFLHCLFIPIDELVKLVVFFVLWNSFSMFISVHVKVINDFLDNDLSTVNREAFKTKPVFTYQKHLIKWCYMEIMS